KAPQDSESKMSVAENAPVRRRSPQKSAKKRPARRENADGGTTGAKSALESFWERMGWAAQFSPFRRSPLDVLLGRWSLDNSPPYIVYDLTSRLLSPYDMNPQGANPAAGDPGRERRLLASHRVANPLVRHRHQRAHRPRARVPQRRPFARGA